ncbi:MAG TPA: YetF domain-containing protein [Pilimelia sp.]|nr:YetF domain-containing protein [Pilimelia sp.]
MLIQSWFDVWRVAVVAAVTYPLLIALLRLSGKRTLAKMNAFDLVVTVALGSTLATILLSRDVSIVEGVAALVMLVALQLVATWLSVRARPVRRLLKAQPTLLARDGRLLPEALRAQRVTAEEVRQAIRSHGLGDLGLVAAVVLETDGTFSVIPAQQAGRLTALHGVPGVEPGGGQGVEP